VACNQSTASVEAELKEFERKGGLALLVHDD
jgi:hypothetical protein